MINNKEIKPKDLKDIRKEINKAKAKERQLNHLADILTYETARRIGHKVSTKEALKLRGSTTTALKAHLESLWSDGMSWDNYGLNGWHIDHIKPISAFIKEGQTSLDDLKIINQLSNLQPLWRADNIRKGGKYTAPKPVKSSVKTKAYSQIISPC